MQKCINTDGSYNCSCDEFFKRDPADRRNCLGESDICSNFFKFRFFFNIVTCNMTEKGCLILIDVIYQ